MTKTATIRVPAQTRDTLSELAHQRGQSLAAYLSSLSHEQWRKMIIAAEREATVRDAKSPAARAEYALWESTTGDGID